MAGIVKKLLKLDHVLHYAFFYSTSKVHIDKFKSSGAYELMDLSQGPEEKKDDEQYNSKLDLEKVLFVKFVANHTELILCSLNISKHDLESKLKHGISEVIVNLLARQHR